MVRVRAKVLSFGEKILKLDKIKKFRNMHRRRIGDENLIVLVADCREHCGGVVVRRDTTSYDIGLFLVYRDEILLESEMLGGRFMGEEKSKILIQLFPVELMNVFCAESLGISAAFECFVGKLHDRPFVAFLKRAVKIPDKQFHTILKVSRKYHNGKDTNQ